MEPLIPDTAHAPTVGPKNSLIVVAIVLIVMLLGAGGAYAFFYYSPDPQGQLQKMFAASETTTSVEYDAHVTVHVETAKTFLYSPTLTDEAPETPEPMTQTFDIAVAGHGSSDTSDKNNPKGNFVWDIEAMTPLQKDPINLNIQARFINKITYLRFDKLPTIGFITLTPLTNQWMTIDIEALKNQFAPPDLQKKLDELQKEQELTPDEMKQLTTMVRDAGIFQITETLRNEFVSGVPTYHYRYAINKSALEKFTEEISPIVSDKPLSDEEKGQLKEALNVISSMGGELWIGRLDSRPYKMTLQVLLKNEEDPKVTGSLSATIAYKNYNKPVQIDVPADSKTIEEVVNSLFGGMMGGMMGENNFDNTLDPMSTGEDIFELSPPPSPMTKPDPTIDTDKDGLPDYSEELWGTDPNNPDTDKDGFKDAEEIKNGFNPNGPGKI